MAEAAPSGPGTGGSTAAAPGAPPATAPATDSGTLPGIAPARKLSPIPPGMKPGKSPDSSAGRPKPPSLPGVVINRPEASGGMPGRDNIGRFVARGDGAEGESDDPIERELRADRRLPGETVPDDEGEASGDPKAKTPAVAAVKPDLPPGAPDPSKGKVKFGDRTYDTHEQALSAAQAVLGNLNKTTTDLRTRTEEREYGYQAAYAWKDAHDKVMAELTALRGGKAPAAGAQSGAARTPAGNTPATLPASVEELLSAMPEDVFKGFEETLLAKGIPDAGKYLMQHTLDAVMKQILPALRAEMAEKSAPFEEFAGNAQAEENAGQLIQLLVSARGPDGQEAFPELKDPQIVHEIGTTWRNAGMDPAIALTDAGLIAAVGLYRTVKGFSGPAPAAMVPASPSTPANGAFVAPRAGVAASISADGDTSIAPGASRQDTRIADPNARRLASALRHAAPLRDPVLGFPRARAHR